MFVAIVVYIIYYRGVNQEDTTLSVVLILDCSSCYARMKENRSFRVKNIRIVTALEQIICLKQVV